MISENSNLLSINDSNIFKRKLTGKKTEFMVCSTDPENNNIKKDDDALKQVSKSKYLGSIFTEDGKLKKTWCMLSFG